jgi:hypothetical protein
MLRHLSVAGNQAIAAVRCSLCSAVRVQGMQTKAPTNLNRPGAIPQSCHATRLRPQFLIRAPTLETVFSQPEGHVKRQGAA